eukprot:gnl/Hemi2/14518_TR4922_c0_g1_i1.p1 gnl/Hemi2/14518_TR4922_c0_g1~~gnl/Hemi2/14518_TR4922_c0_g1_i1.p1  ORF type:complete len:283 (-),score=60.67 gnl/Hemi2/14518_TR4922_c0_g1_i1:103-951(-)
MIAFCEGGGCTGYSLPLPPPTTACTHRVINKPVFKQISRQSYTEEHWPTLQAAISYIFANPLEQITMADQERSYRIVYDICCNRLNDMLLQDLEGVVTAFLQRDVLPRLLACADEAAFLSQLATTCTHFVRAVNSLSVVFLYMDRTFLKHQLKARLFEFFARHVLEHVCIRGPLVTILEGLRGGSANAPLPFGARELYACLETIAPSFLAFFSRAFIDAYQLVDVAWCKAEADKYAQADLQLQQSLPPLPAHVEPSPLKRKFDDEDDCAYYSGAPDGMAMDF